MSHGSSGGRPSVLNGKVGRQLVIIRGAWRTAVTNVAVDPSELGGVMMVYLKTKHQTLTIAKERRIWKSKLNINHWYKKTPSRSHHKRL
jgi:hypothetical protein